MSAEFKKIAGAEIEEFKAEYRARFPGRSTDDLRDEDLLREVMNTVGKAGKLGERVRCVVSVSMLTEGWDANTVTHILGVRAFGTQLLCEQVVGRGLRRMSYAVNDAGRFNARLPRFTASRSRSSRVPGRVRTRRLVRCQRACAHSKTGSRARSRSAPGRLPLRRAERTAVGERSIPTLDDLKRHRDNEVSFLLAKLVLEKYFTEKPWLFPQILGMAKRWLAECVTCKDNTFPQLLLLVEFAHDAADRIYKAIVESASGTPALKPILRPYDVLGSTRYVDFDPTRPVYPTDPGKCHISHVVADTGSWEQKLAQALEEMREVARYVKNQSLGFTIPYTLNGEEKQYYPDFVACVESRSVRLQPDVLNLIIEVTGEARKDKAAKVTTARTLWVPAVNNHGGFGRWAFVEVTDPWDAQHTIRAAVQADGRGGGA